MDTLLPYIPLLMRGLLVTVVLALTALMIATALGALAAAGRIGGGRIGGALAFAYTTIFRGVPDLVLILLVYFGGQRALNDLGAVLGWDYISLSTFWAGAIAIGILYGAYLAETFRGAYLSVPPGQAEAARALGLRNLAVLRHVTLPQSVRAALPGFGNTWMVLVKSTAVVSVIGLQDLVGLANDTGKSVREPFTFFAFVLLLYLGITFVSQQVLAWVERRSAIPGRTT